MRKDNFDLGGLYLKLQLYKFFKEKNMRNYCAQIY